MGIWRKFMSMFPTSLWCVAGRSSMSLMKKDVLLLGGLRRASISRQDSSDSKQKQKATQTLQRWPDSVVWIHYCHDFNSKHFFLRLVWLAYSWVSVPCDWLPENQSHSSSEADDFDGLIRFSSGFSGWTVAVIDEGPNDDRLLYDESVV